MAESRAFHHAEAEYARLRPLFDAGQLSEGQFTAALDALMVEHDGRFWTLGAQSGQWYVHDGAAWRQATPPHRLAAAAPAPQGYPAGADATRLLPGASSAAPPAGGHGGGWAPSPPAAPWPPYGAAPIGGDPTPAQAEAYRTAHAAPPPAPGLPKPLKTGSGCLCGCAPLLLLLGAGLTWRLVDRGYDISNTERDVATTCLILATFAGSCGLATLVRWFLALPVLLLALVWTVGGFVAGHFSWGVGSDFWWWPDVTMVTGAAAVVGAFLGLLAGTIGRSAARRGVGPQPVAAGWPGTPGGPGR